MKFWKREEVSPEEQERRTAAKEVERRLKDASKAYDARVKDATKAVEQAEKAYESRVKQAEKQLAGAQSSKKLASFARVTLFDDRITTPDGTSVLSPDVRADCDTAGNLERSSRVTATRLLTVGIFAFAFKKKKTHDSRELYLAVETPDFMSVLEVDPDKGPAARKFAAQITSQAKQAPAVIEQKKKMAGFARAEVEKARADRSAIEAANEHLRSAEAETAEADRIRAELDALAPTSPG